MLWSWSLYYLLSLIIFLFSLKHLIPASFPFSLSFVTAWLCILNNPNIYRGKGFTEIRIAYSVFHNQKLQQGMRNKVETFPSLVCACFPLSLAQESDFPFDYRHSNSSVAEPDHQWSRHLAQWSLLVLVTQLAFLSGPVVLCGWGGDAAACSGYYPSYGPLNPVQAWQYYELWCTVTSLLSHRCFWWDQHLLFLKKNREQQMPNLQEIVPGLETKAEEKPAMTRQKKLLELKAPAVPSWALDGSTRCHLLGRPVPSSVFREFWPLQLLPSCLEEPVCKFRAPGWVGV